MTADADLGAIRAVLDERDRRYSERFDAQEKAVAAALAAAKEAVLKAEQASEKRFDGVNEFRATLSDQAATFMPRKEAQAESAMLREKIDTTNTLLSALSGRVDTLIGARTGATDMWGWIVGAVGVLLALGSFALSLR